MRGKEGTQRASKRRVSIYLAAVAAVSVVLLAACKPSSEPSGEVSQGPAGEEAVEVVAKGKAYIPDTLELEAGQMVTVEVSNQGDDPHDFAIGELDLNTGTIGPGEVATATFTVPVGGAQYVCTYHSGMSGQIDVR